MSKIPTEHWYPLTIDQTTIPGGFTIVLTTDVPCHLWLFWTYEAPWVHAKSRIERGLAVPWDAYWCFVSWHIIDQDEPGDTTLHTFQWLGWVTCQTKYFRFHGDIAGKTSPSDSPIFHKHYVAPPELILYEHEDTSPDTYQGASYLQEAGWIWTPILSHEVRRIDVLLGMDNPSSFPVYVKTYLAGPDHFPLGAPLSEGSIPDGSVLTWPPIWHEIEVTPYDYEIGVEYCTIVTMPDAPWTNYCIIVLTEDYVLEVPYPNIVFWGIWQGPNSFHGPHFKNWGY